MALRDVCVAAVMNQAMYDLQSSAWKFAFRCQKDESVSTQDSEAVVRVQFLEATSGGLSPPVVSRLLQVEDYEPQLEPGQMEVDKPQLEQGQMEGQIDVAEGEVMQERVNTLVNVL